jgi:hypothetical protein
MVLMYIVCSRTFLFILFSNVGYYVRKRCLYPWLRAALFFFCALSAKIKNMLQDVVALNIFVLVSLCVYLTFFDVLWWTYWSCSYFLSYIDMLLLMEFYFMVLFPGNGFHVMLICRRLGL